MWEGKRSLNLRRHSDSSLPGYRKRLDGNLCSFDDDRIPPLHDLAPCAGDGDEEFDDEWFAKLAGSNEPLSSSSLNDGKFHNYGLSSKKVSFFLFLDLSRFPLLTTEGPPRDRALWPLRLGLDKLRRRGSITITEADPSYKVAYIGNVLTSWAKGRGKIFKLSIGL